MFPLFPFIIPVQSTVQWWMKVDELLKSSHHQQQHQTGWADQTRPYLKSESVIRWLTAHKYPKPENAILVWSAYSSIYAASIHLHSSTTQPNLVSWKCHISLSRRHPAKQEWWRGQGPKKHCRQSVTVAHLRCHFRCLTMTRMSMLLTHLESKGFRGGKSTSYT